MQKIKQSVEKLFADSGIFTFHVIVLSHTTHTEKALIMQQIHATCNGKNQISHVCGEGSF